MVVAGLLVTAPAASATTRFVSPTGPNSANCSSGAPCDFAKVVTLTGPNDTIVVKQGTYPDVAGFTINHPGVEIAGEPGAGKPNVKLTGVSPTGQGIVFGPAAAGGKVRNLEFEALAGAVPVIATARATVSDIKVTTAGQCISLGAPDSTLENAQLNFTPSVASPGCLSTMGANTTIRNVDVTEQAGAPGLPGMGMVNVAGAGSTIDRLRTTGASGVTVGSFITPGAGDQTTIRRSRLSVSSTSAITPAPALMLAGPARVTDTVVTLTNSTGFPGASAITALADAKLRNVTAVASGTGTSALLGLAGTAPRAVSVKNSILRGDAAANDVTILPGAPAPFNPGDPFCTTLPSLCLPTVPADVVINNSSFRGATGSLNAASGSNQTDDPKFTDAAAGNFKPLAGSPVIDAGVSDPDNGTVDIDGRPRKSGAAVDIGAHEFAVPAARPTPPRVVAPRDPAVVPPPVDATLPSLSRLALTNKRFRVGREATVLSARAKRGTTFFYTLSEAGRVGIAVQKASTGRRRGRSCVKPSRKLRKAKKCTRYTTVGALTRTSTAGANAVPFSGRIGSRALKPGKYRARFTATDAAGNVASRKPTVGFTVVKR